MRLLQWRVVFRKVIKLTKKGGKDRKINYVFIYACITDRKNSSVFFPKTVSFYKVWDRYNGVQYLEKKVTFL